MRCVGHTTRKAGGSAVVDRADVFVTSDNLVEVQLRKGNGTRQREVTLDPEVLVDLAHQLLAARITINERWGIK